jgi:cysteinyl-tRNA synthetase
MLEFSEEAMGEAASAYRRIEGFVLRAVERLGEITPGALPRAFGEAMDDDLGVPQALAVVHDTVRTGNAALDAGDDATARARAGEVRAMMGALGLDPIEWSETTADSARMHGVIDVLVRSALDDRADARGRKDYAAADAIRDRLKNAGIALEDTAEGVRWTLAEED